MGAKCLDCAPASYADIKKRINLVTLFQDLLMSLFVSTKRFMFFSFKFPGQFKVVAAGKTNFNCFDLNLFDKS